MMFAVLFLEGLLLVGFIGCVVCLIVPRFRKYALPVFSVPVAFGFCSGAAAAAVGLFLQFIDEKFEIGPPSDSVRVILLIPALTLVLSCGFLGAKFSFSTMSDIWVRLSARREH